MAILRPFPLKQKDECLMNEVVKLTEIDTEDRLTDGRELSEKSEGIKQNSTIHRHRQQMVISREKG